MSEILPDSLEQASSEPWPEQYRGSFSAKVALAALEEELRTADRNLQSLSDQCALAQVDLNRCNHSPEILEHDPDALDYYEEALTEVREAHAEAEAKRDRIHAALQEAVSRDILYLPPAPVVSTTEDEEPNYEEDAA